MHGSTQYLYQLYWNYYVHATDISYHNVMGLGFHIVILLPYQNWKYTVKPPNKGHFGNNIKLIQVFCPL